MKKLCVLLLCALLVFSASGCTSSEGAQLDLFSMDTLIRLNIYGDDAEEALSLVRSELQRLESLFSRYDPDSDVSRVNTSGGTACSVSAETASLLEQALDFRVRTDGLFDITIAPLMDLWGFSSEEYRVPEAEEIADALTHVGCEVWLLGQSVTLSDPLAALDLGGIAKGYTGDLLIALLRQQGINSAVLILGGNVALLGSRPDGEDWRIGVRDPQDSGSQVGVIEASDCHVVTSGGYERNFQQDGIIYHHILDPRTGAPADSDLLSVTIVADTGLMADALSTALFIMGKDASIEHWRTFGDFEMLLITEDGQILATEGLHFDATNGAYQYETIQNKPTY